VLGDGVIGEDVDLAAELALEQVAELFLGDEVIDEALGLGLLGGEEDIIDEST